jgi:hypothetical protein
MPINKLSVDNLSSFIGFTTDDQLKKYNLVFGTNGAGKSTLGNLLHLLDNYRRKPGPESDQALVQFLKARKSKEAPSERVTVKVALDDGEETFLFDSARNRLHHDGNSWAPVKVFNEEYTDRTIGEFIKVDLKSGILIGQASIELERLKGIQDGLEVEHARRLEAVDALVRAAEADYREATGSTGSTSHAINRETLLAQTCPYSEKPQTLAQRQKLGSGKTQSLVERLDVAQVKLRLNTSDAVKKCAAQSKAPTVGPDLEKLLKDYTDFFTLGVKIYQGGGQKACPFCLREWPNATETIATYERYLQSTYNKKREEIAAIKNQIESYRNQVTAQIGLVAGRFKLAEAETEKYQLDISAWRPLVYDEAKHDAVCNLIDRKHDAMDEVVSLEDSLLSLEKSHTDCIEANNEIISGIIDAVDRVTAKRKELNRDLVEHFAAQAWAACKEHREALSAIEKKLAETTPKLSKLQEESPPMDTIRGVFNRLIEFMAIGEYSLDENRRLQISIGKPYDISSEGVRISSAQRKLLSLCYFFAEIVSELRDVRELKQYVLVFDDPVDSADYIFFYSIATVIEKAESVLARILNVRRVKFGQVIVMTHNSLLYERLSARWADYVRCLRKEKALSIFTHADKSINNYNEYISEICKYYNNPAGQRRQMMYIGNLIRRVLEILAGFDTLGDQNLQQLLDGMGKPRLALLANHLSHESFTRVLNPLSTPEELQAACGELLDVIKERHPRQYDAIVAKYGLNLAPSGER